MPKPSYLHEALSGLEAGRVKALAIDLAVDRAVRETIAGYEAAGATVVTDGEQARGFVPYPLRELPNVKPEGGEGAVAPRTETLRLVEGPFRYGAFARSEVIRARQWTTTPLKQSIVSPASLVGLYPAAGIAGYGRDQFLQELSEEAARDIAGCLQAGAALVDVPFVISDAGGNTVRWQVREFAEIMGDVLRRLSAPERASLRVGISVESTVPDGGPVEHALSLVLPELFDLDVGGFCIPMARVGDRRTAWATLRRWWRPPHRCLIGVTDPWSHAIEDTATIADQMVEAARQLPLAYLGTTDDAGFARVIRGQELSRELVFAKVAAREAGTRLASKRLGLESSV